MVGLRWWNEQSEDGTESWIFESLDVSKHTYIYNCINNVFIENTNKSDSKVFWIVNYGTPVAWVVFIIVSILKFNIENVTICLIALCLSVTNLLGYIKCEKNHNVKMKGFLYN